VRRVFATKASDLEVQMKKGGQAWLEAMIAYDSRRAQPKRLLPVVGGNGQSCTRVPPVLLDFPQLNYLISFFGAEQEITIYSFDPDGLSFHSPCKIFGERWGVTPFSWRS